MDDVEREGIGESDSDENDRLAQELADGALDPDEVPGSVEPWDEGSDDET